MKIQIDEIMALADVYANRSYQKLPCDKNRADLAEAFRAALTAAPAEPDDVLYRIDDNGVMHIAEPTYKEYLSDAEPVAWMGLRGGVKHMTASFLIAEAEPETYDTPLYAAPQPQREPLTNGEIYTAYIEATNQTLRPQDERLALAFARAIEKSHGIGVAK